MKNEQDAYRRYEIQRQKRLKLLKVLLGLSIVNVVFAIGNLFVNSETIRIVVAILFWLWIIGEVWYTRMQRKENNLLYEYQVERLEEYRKRLKNMQNEL
ncbi:hypothetical protein [Limosilactobacillus pontis]|uniref:hypothetical protein n=1 Tax=Limosilactobacillus pontis TaxID=35787 RepID=UPI0039A3DCF7